MHRTTIMLPDDLLNRARRRAESDGTSLGELIRRCLDRVLAESAKPTGPDPLFADDAVFRGPAPQDIAAEHDRYLYGEDP
ncbi:MAG: hypothetical protein P1P84_03795 [Deferrisomatales bacterium]|nr:hypothetical protein [Deferrisomatales bacterium]